MAGRAPKRLTASRLHNIAVHYLERYISSKANLRRLLMKRVHKAARHFDEDPSEGAALVEKALNALEDANLLNDDRYAKIKALALHRRGVSERMIRAKLQVKGVPSPCVDRALEAIRAQRGDSDLLAACTFARKRRLGPWSREPVPDDWDLRKKLLAKFARAGFSFDVARTVLASTDADDLEMQASGAEDFWDEGGEGGAQTVF